MNFDSCRFVERTSAWISPSKGHTSKSPRNRGCPGFPVLNHWFAVHGYVVDDPRVSWKSPPLALKNKHLSPSRHPRFPRIATAKPWMRLCLSARNRGLAQILFFTAFFLYLFVFYQEKKKKKEGGRPKNGPWKKSGKPWKWRAKPWKAEGKPWDVSSQESSTYRPFHGNPRNFSHYCATQWPQNRPFSGCWPKTCSPMS